jgi:hypothetical protein
MFVLNNEDGTANESPSIKKVDAQVLQYWKDRANSTKHPVLRARYADMVWDFTKKVTNKSPDYKMAQLVVDSNVEIAKLNCHKYKASVIKKLERALVIAISISDIPRVEAVRDAILKYEDLVTEDPKPGLWGFSYDLLFENDKVKLTDTQRGKLVKSLEDHLTRASKPENHEETDPWGAEAAALRLAKHYRKIGRIDDIKRVLVTYGDSFVQKGKKAEALQVSAWLQRVYHVFIDFGLKAEAENISTLIRNVGEKAKTELKSFSYTMEVSKEQVDKYITSLTEGEIDDVLNRIAVHYIPKKSRVEKQLKDLAKEAPVAFLIPIEIQDNQGRPLAKVGSLEDDLTGHITKQMSQNLSIESIYLGYVLEALTKKWPSFEELLLVHLFLTPLFKEDRKSIVELGVKEYIKGNHISAVHILVPQIENAIRVLVETAGKSVLKSTTGGGFNFRTLDDLLRDPLVSEVLGEDLVFYFRVLLVDPRGWNLRNCVCHGLCDNSEFSPSMSDRIVHILLCLSLVRKKE